MATCEKDYSLTIENPVVLLAYWKFDESPASANRLDSKSTNHLKPAPGGGLSVIAGKISNGVGFDANPRGLITIVDSTDLIYNPSKGMTFFGWVKSTATDPTDGANLFLLGSNDAPINDWTFNFGVGLNNVNFNVDDGTTIEGISKTIVLGTWHFMRAWIDPADNKSRFQLDLGAISISTNAFTAFETATLSSVAMSTTAVSPLYPKQFDEFGIYQGVLPDADAATIYNGGAGRTYPDLPYA